MQTGYVLKVLRDLAGLRQKEVSAELDWYNGKLAYIETGYTEATPDEVKLLLRLYKKNKADFELLETVLSKLQGKRK
jgi:transcriptional regulator with XRE-family HTH domain